MAASFIRNHTLYLSCSLFMVLASHTLSIVDAITNWWHACICVLLSFLPKARVQFPVSKPARGYHPAVLVTGTSSGIGHDTAVALASIGYTVFAGVRSWEDGVKVERAFLDSIDPQGIYNNRWTRPSWFARLLDTIGRSLGAPGYSIDDQASEDIDYVALDNKIASSSNGAGHHLHRTYDQTNGIKGNPSNGHEYPGSDDELKGTESSGAWRLRQRQLRRIRRNEINSASDLDKDGRSSGSDMQYDLDFDPHNLSRDRKRMLAPYYAEMLESTGSIIPVIIDVTEKASVDGAYEAVRLELERREIPLVALVNNAGVTASGPMDMAVPGFIDYCMSVNFHGPVRVAQTFMPLLRASSGRIINVSSIMSWLIGPGFGVYCASKAALSAASRAWHYELANNNISVSVVEPGLTRTSLWKKLEAELRFHNARLNGVPFPRKNRERKKGVPLAMPGDEAVASTSQSQSPNSEASSIGDTIDNEDQSLYNPMIRRIQTSNELAPMFALPTHHAVSAIIHGIESKYPKSTYRVGWDARWLSLATWLASEEVVEWVCRIVGIVSEN